MKSPAPHRIDFDRKSAKQTAAWDNFRPTRAICDVTLLRMLANRLRVTAPRTLIETQIQYSKRIAGILMERNKSHLSMVRTLSLIHKWFWYIPERVTF